MIQVLRRSFSLDEGDERRAGRYWRVVLCIERSVLRSFFACSVE